MVFIDADDIISPNLLYFLSKAIEEHDADLVYYDFKYYAESQQKKAMF
ncbi:hypothetical protein J4732_17165 [Serratia marcescens]|uniref:Uncharacterized protein n=1 Tax=Serratia marcescens TaxID=615 RepID=A0A939NRT0_SERMA|nr:hypothetical protein [Serratia marcescens]